MPAIFPRRYFPLLLPAVVAVAGGIFWFKQSNKSSIATLPDIADSISLPSPSLSILAEPPDWLLLEPFQRTITREDFQRLLTTIFTTGAAWQNFIRIDESHAIIQADTPDDFFTLEFARPDLSSVAPRTWRSTNDLPPAPLERPLQGLHIAIDPGHIGGDWAKMEERWFVMGSDKPVTEGDMTLAVAKLLKPRLEVLGAKVSLVRESTEPVTTIRPASLMAASQNPSAGESSQKLAERLFYRTSEVNARARIVNEILKPDLVLCLHFNAEGWGDPLSPTLVPQTHFHVILNGAYDEKEIALADQRCAMVHKILQRTHEEELLVGSSIANTFAEMTKLPPYAYLPDSSNSRPISGHPYLWVRNLLANRLYECPVIFMEPYVMNSTTDYARIQAGNYEGLREIAGEMRPSIFHEYAAALTEGLKRHYSGHRAKAN